MIRTKDRPKIDLHEQIKIMKKIEEIRSSLKKTGHRGRAICVRVKNKTRTKIIDCDSDYEEIETSEKMEKIEKSLQNLMDKIRRDDWGDKEDTAAYIDQRFKDEVTSKSLDNLREEILKQIIFSSSGSRKKIKMFLGKMLKKIKFPPDRGESKEVQKIEKLTKKEFEDISKELENLTPLVLRSSNFVKNELKIKINEIQKMIQSISTKLQDAVIYSKEIQKTNIVRWAHNLIGPISDIKNQTLSLSGTVEGIMKKVEKLLKILKSKRSGKKFRRKVKQILTKEENLEIVNKVEEVKKIILKIYENPDLEALEILIMEALLETEKGKVFMKALGRSYKRRHMLVSESFKMVNEKFDFIQTQRAPRKSILIAFSSPKESLCTKYGHGVKLITKDGDSQFKLGESKKYFF